MNQVCQARETHGSNTSGRRSEARHESVLSVTFLGIESEPLLTPILTEGKIGENL